MSTQYGSAVNFAFTDATGLTTTGLSGVLLQSAEVSNNAEIAPVRDATGKTVQRTFYDFNFDATLEYIPTGAAIANARTNSTLKTPGTVINITACPTRPDLVKSYWQVESGTRVSGSNTEAAKITVPLKAFSGMSSITGSTS